MLQPFQWEQRSVTSAQPPHSDSEPADERERSTATGNAVLEGTISPEAAAAARPAANAMDEALQEIQTPEQAEQVAAAAVAAAGEVTEHQLREQEGASPQPAEAI